jgi:Leucine-rich repeat (LRR) protein
LIGYQIILIFSAYSFDRKVQRFAMAVLFFSTGGSSWDETLGWVKDDDECIWYQSRDDVCVNETLQVLFSGANALKEVLPNNIALLTSLTWLYLSSNSLTGSIPSEIGALTTLTLLDLSDNSLTGSIPNNIALLTSLTLLDLSDNSLTGSIPSDIGALTTLTFMNLFNNSLTGSIPISLCNQGFLPGLMRMSDACVASEIISKKLSRLGMICLSFSV